MITIRLGEGGRYGRHQEKKKKKTDKQTDFMVNPRHKKDTTTEILRNPNLSIKTPKKLTDEQTSRQQISFSGTL
jgi:hypothetical protein